MLRKVSASISTFVALYYRDTCALNLRTITHYDGALNTKNVPS